MRLLGSKATAEPPVRHDQVMKLLNLRMRESDAADQELSMADPGDRTPRFDRAKRDLWAAERESTQAEIRAAGEAERRYAVDWWSAAEENVGEGWAR